MMDMRLAHKKLKRMNRQHTGVFLQIMVTFLIYTVYQERMSFFSGWRQCGSNIPYVWVR